MKIFLSNDFSKAMLEQEREMVIAFISSIEKISTMNKTQILDLDTVISLSAANEKPKLYAYNVGKKDYVVFSFAKRDEIILIDCIKLTNNGVVSIVYPKPPTEKNN